MKKKKNPGAKPFKDFRRLISPQDLLSRAGTVMMRKSPKATIWTAGITSSGYLSSYLGLPGFTGLQAIVAPFIVGGGMLGIGAGIKYIPRTISRKLATIAEANDLNLMEDYRKSQVLEHLNVLWERVFWYESDIRYTHEERLAELDRIIADKKYLRGEISGWNKGVLQRLGAGSEKDIDDIVMAIMTEKPLTDKIEMSREGYIISSIYALRHALPQSSQAKQIGFCLNLYEDACDGAYFDESDVKLFEQYIGNIALTNIKNEVGFGRLDAARQIAKKASWRFWFYLITRKIATGVGKAVRDLNECYHTNIFNSQVLLWPGEENAEWMNDFTGAREKVLKLRESIIRGVLGYHYENAAIMLDRMLLPCFEFATDLRLRYDPEYCDGSLDYVSEDKSINIKNNIINDLQAYGYRQKDINQMQEYAAKGKNDMSAFMDYLDTKGHKRLFDDKLALRAVKIIYHVNKNGIRKMFQDNRLAAHQANIDHEINKAVAQKEIYSGKLTGLRLHHQLTMLQIAGYKNLAKELAYSG
ncbi:MAG TPA: hypothetical protein VMX36_02215 [Sedimentisphaerales bacterium]|nr:hypothetical protein [Sedimentisphaerales bacterium]